MTSWSKQVKESVGLLHKSEKGVASADKDPDFIDKVGRKCYAPTAENRLLQETFMSVPLTLQDERRLSKQV